MNIKAAFQVLAALGTILLILSFTFLGRSVAD